MTPAKRAALELELAELRREFRQLEVDRSRLSRRELELDRRRRAVDDALDDLELDEKTKREKPNAKNSLSSSTKK